MQGIGYDSWRGDYQGGLSQGGEMQGIGYDSWRGDYQGGGGRKGVKGQVRGTKTIAND